jgi:glycosyltransferase involved in cell wall biosynthesis
VLWLGHVADRGLFLSLLANARVYVHGHSVGGINPSLVEAMTVGARIAALDTPFNRETLFDGGEYFAAPDGHLTRLICQLATESASVAGERRHRVRIIAASRFDLKEVADAYERLLERVAGRGVWDSTAVGTSWQDDDECAEHRFVEVIGQPNE